MKKSILLISMVVVFLAMIIVYSVLGYSSAVNVREPETALGNIRWTMELQEKPWCSIDIYDEAKGIFIVSKPKKGASTSKELYLDLDQIFINEKGEEVDYAIEEEPYIEDEYSDIYDGEFNELCTIEGGGTVANDRAGEEKLHWVIKNDGTKLLLDENYEIIQEYGQDLIVYSSFCNNDKALLYFNDKLVCIDASGNIIFEKKANYGKGDWAYNVREFIDGLAVFTLDGYNYGILNEQGDIVIEAGFRGVNTLQLVGNNQVIVQYGGKYGIGYITMQTEGEV